jgi:hypothetical protein
MLPDLSQMRIRTANINVNGSETHTAAFTVNVSQTSQESPNPTRAAVGREAGYHECTGAEV